MSDEIVKQWFGDEFDKLHPLLQQLHVNGGKLSGEVEISYGRGIAGMIGKRLAKKMKLPRAGRHQLVVDISHDKDGLHWGRNFDGDTPVYSLFKPVGTIGNGYWIEQTGPLELKLTVDIREGGWFWRCLNVRFAGIPVPKWLIPQTNAYKVIENGQYRFHVAFFMPLIGALVSYQGLLQAEQN